MQSTAALSLRASPPSAAAPATSAPCKPAPDHPPTAPYRCHIAAVCSSDPAPECSAIPAAMPDICPASHRAAQNSPLLDLRDHRRDALADPRNIGASSPDLSHRRAAPRPSITPAAVRNSECERILRRNLHQVRRLRQHPRNRSIIHLRFDCSFRPPLATITHAGPSHRDPTDLDSIPDRPAVFLLWAVRALLARTALLRRRLRRLLSERDRTRASSTSAA
jgi:hypothetical protein